MKYLSAAAILFYALAMVEGVEVERHHHKRHNVLAQQLSNKTALEIIESGKEVVPEVPAADARVSPSNCCVPIKRTNQKLIITGDNLAQFKHDFLQLNTDLHNFLLNDLVPPSQNTEVVPW